MWDKAIKHGLHASDGCPKDAENFEGLEGADLRGVDASVFES